MATTINNYSVGLELDAGAYIDASKLSRAETRALTTDINRARDPMEKYAREQDRLTQALEKGAISQELYDRLLDTSARKHNVVTAAMDAQAKEEERLNKQKQLGISVTQSMLTVEERQAEKLRQLDSLYQDQAISLETYKRGIDKATKEINDANPELIQHNRLMEEGRQVYLANLNPMEKYEAEVERLSKLHKSGAINLETYNRAIEKSKPSLEQKHSALDRMSKMANIATGAIMTIRAGIDSVAAMKGTFDNIANEIDRTSKAAQQAGITTQQYGSLEFAVKGAGVEPQQLEMAFKELLKRGFEGNDAHEGLMRLSDELMAMETHAERVQYAVARIGDDAAIKLVPFLSQGRDAIEETASFADKWLGLSESQVIAVEDYKSVWDQVGTITQGVAQTFVAELAPVMSVIGESIIGQANGWGDVKGTIRDVVDNSVYIYGTLVDIAEVATLWHKTMYNIVTMDFSQIGEDVGKALEGGTGEKYLQAVYDKRFENDRAAAERQRKTDEERKKREEELRSQKLNTIEEVAQKEQEKVESYESLYTQAISNAHKVFEDQANQAKQMMDSISKGPSQIEVGSAEAARYMAEITNRSIAATMDFDKGSYTDTQLIEEAAKQLEELVAMNTKQTEQTKMLERLVEVTSENGFRRIG